jgi:hypothetical protein
MTTEYEPSTWNGDFSELLGMEKISRHPDEIQALKKAISDIQWAKKQVGCTCDPHCDLKWNEQEQQFSAYTSHSDKCASR